MVNIGYVRTSRADQYPENQIRELVAHGIDRNHIFTDEGISGSTPAQERPGFQAMIEFIDLHDVQVLYVYEISRLGRTFYDTIDVVRELEEVRGVIVWSLSPQEGWTQTIDRSMRNLMLSILAWVAERERDNLRERTKAGLQRAKEEGKHLGRPYRDINIKKVREYREKGISWAAISRIMDIPYSTLMRRKEEIEK